MFIEYCLRHNHREKSERICEKKDISGMSKTKELKDRGYLLRETNLLSSQILSQHVRFSEAGVRLEKETVQRSSLLERIAAAEAEHAAAERQRQYESANDAELVGLQRAVASATLKRQELIKQTKSARSDRDRAREESLSAYYSRIGAEFESALVTGSGQASRAFEQSVPWTPDALKLLSDTEGVWRRASNQGIITRDLIEGTLALANLQLKPEKQLMSSLQQQQLLDSALLGNETSSSSSEASGISSTATNAGNAFPAAPSSSGTAGIFIYTGANTALSETTKALTLIHEILDACDVLKERVASLRSASSAEVEDVAVNAIERLVQLITQNASFQKTFLVSVESSLSSTSKEDEETNESSGGTS